MKATAEKTIHPYASIFPPASAEEFKDLKESIDQHGLREPIVLLGNEIIDGRNRYKACLELKVAGQFRQYSPAKDGPDPLAFVIDRNLNRRHLTTGQRAALAVELREMAAKMAKQAEAGEPEALVVDGTKPPMTQAQAAAATGVSERSVREAERIAEENPEAFEEVKAGETSLNAAAKATPSRPTSPPAQTGKPVTSYRAECADMVAPNLGDKFAEAIRNDTILRDKELREFMKLPVLEQRAIAPLVAKNWKTRDAVKFNRGVFEKNDAIRDLLNLAIMKGGEAVVRIDGYHILLVDEKNLTRKEYAGTKALMGTVLAKQKAPTVGTPEAPTK